MELMALINEYELNNKLDAYTVKLFNNTASLTIPLMSWKSIKENDDYIKYLINRYTGFYNTIQLIKNKKIIFQENI